MGYTTSPSRILLGLGCSAISDAYYAFSQNEKTISAYLEKIESGEINITEEGKPFVRNICMAFDPNIQNSEKSSPIFSKAI